MERNTSTPPPFPLPFPRPSITAAAGLTTTGRTARVGCPTSAAATEEPAGAAMMGTKWRPLATTTSKLVGLELEELAIKTGLRDMVGVRFHFRSETVTRERENEYDNVSVLSRLTTLLFDSGMAQLSSHWARTLRARRPSSSTELAKSSTTIGSSAALASDLVILNIGVRLILPPDRRASEANERTNEKNDGGGGGGEGGGLFGMKVEASYHRGRRRGRNELAGRRGGGQVREKKQGERRRRTPAVIELWRSHGREIFGMLVMWYML